MCPERLCYVHQTEISVNCTFITLRTFVVQKRETPAVLAQKITPPAMRLLQFWQTWLVRDSDQVKSSRRLQYDCDS